MMPHENLVAPCIPWVDRSTRPENGELMGTETPWIPGNAGGPLLRLFLDPPESCGSRVRDAFNAGRPLGHLGSMVNLGLLFSVALRAFAARPVHRPAPVTLVPLGHSPDERRGAHRFFSLALHRTPLPLGRTLQPPGFFIARRRGCLRKRLPFTACCFYCFHSIRFPNLTERHREPPRRSNPKHPVVRGDLLFHSHHRPACFPGSGWRHFIGNRNSGLGASV